MNYYHVIYTSSQKGINGSNGYGIRTATEGTPKEYLQQVLTNITAGKFNNVIINSKAPSIQELVDSEGAAIRRVPPRYFFLPLDMADGKILYALGRNVYLGFTETFYSKDKEGNISGMSGRTGNFLIDIYLFEEVPDTRAFLLLYEHPDKGESLFVPRDQAPHKQNFEMADLAVGEPKMLPVDDRDFDSLPSDIPISQKSCDLLFAYIEACLKGVQLLVKYKWEDTPWLIADMLRLLPKEELKRLTFSTNYSGNGFQAPADLLFANQYYQAQYVGKGIVAELENESYTTDESKAFGEQLKAAIDANDLTTARKLVEWMLSPTYKFAEENHLLPFTNKVLFLYIQSPEDFALSMLDDAKCRQQGGNREELVGALAKYLNESEGHRHPFIDLLNQQVENASEAEPMIQCVADLEYYKKYQINVNDTINAQATHIERVLMSSPASAKAAIDTLGLPIVRAYTHDLKLAQTWGELAEELLIINWKENKPKDLDSAQERLQDALSNNEKLYFSIIKNFTSLYDDVFNSVYQSATPTNRTAVANKLKNTLLSPLYDELYNNSLYQKFDQLYHVAVDDADYVNEQNYTQVLPFMKKLGMANFGIGRKVKELVEKLQIPTDAIAKLKEVWGITDTQALLREADNSQRRDKFIEAVLDKDSSLKLEEVKEILKAQKFPADQIDHFLRNSHFASAYSAWRRKHAIVGFFKKIGGLFKCKKKDGNDEPKKNLTSDSRTGGTPTNSKERLIAERDRNAQLARTANEAHKHESSGQGPADAPPTHANEANEVSSEASERRCGVRNAWNPNSYNKEQQDMQNKRGFTEKAITLLFLLLPFALDGAAARYSRANAAYGDDIKSYDQCLVVTARAELNVRTSPSLYNGKRKKKRRDNIAFTLQPGDTIFVTDETQVVNADDMQWLEFKHSGTNFYTDMSKLSFVSNPHYKRAKAKRSRTEKEPEVGGLLGWTKRAAPWMLLVLTVLLFASSFGVWEENKESLIGEERDATGMRPFFVFSLRPYKFFAGLSGRILLAAALSIVVLLILGGAIWGVLWVVKIIMWILIVLGWLMLVGGVIALFANPLVGIIVGGLGALIVFNQDAISAFGNRCVETGLAFFDALNMWQFALDLIKKYWLVSLIIALAPLVIFVVIAGLIMGFAGILRGYEALTTCRYNIKHPCPHCHEPSEPATYYDKDENGNVTEDWRLPCNLRPGIYGLFHITHPVTGTEMPTMLANGRDSYPRTCPHCGKFVQFEAGTEKHIGFIGMPESGKTTLLCAIIALMQKEHGLHFTDKVDEDLVNSVKFAVSNGCLDLEHSPSKTGPEWKPSVQCMMPRKNNSVPFHIYFNDVAGELFTAGGNDSNVLQFSKDVENIVFVVDPYTMMLDKKELSKSVAKWLERNDVSIVRNGKKLEDINNAATSLTNMLNGKKRDIQKIQFTFTLTKSDSGYMKGVDTSNADALRSFMENDLHLANLVSDIESQFKNVGYVAVSTFTKDDSGVQKLCNMLIEQLELD